MTPLLEWTLLRRRLLAPGRPFDLVNHGYLAQMYNDTARQQVYMKAARMGVSEMAVSYTFHACTERDMDILYVMPTADDVSDFSRMKFGPALEASEYLSEMVKRSWSSPDSNRTYRGADKVNLKRLGKKWLILRGGQVGVDGQAHQLKSLDADGIIADEYDEMDSRALPIMRKRYGHSLIKEEKVISTPTYHGVGIHVEWLRSDQREWFIPCPHCGTRQTMTLDHMVIEYDDLERPIAWHEKDGVPYLACEHCELPLDRLAAGEWVPAVTSGTDIHGYRPTQFMSYYVPMLEILNGFKEVDEHKRKEMTNQSLGQAYTPRGGKMTTDVLNRNLREYGFGPLDGVRPSMGVDVGKLFHVTVRAPKDSAGLKKLIYAAEVGSLNDLAKIMSDYNVGTCVVDGMPETKLMRQFQERYRPGRVWLAWYAEGERWEDNVRWDHKRGVVQIARTWSLDKMFADFYDGKCTLPLAIKSIPNYYKHMTSLVRIIEKKQGNAKAKYIHTVDDHFAHSENYAYVADSLNLPWAR